MVGILISAIKIIVLLGLLIGIHETGHFLVAKKCKVKVNEFAIGFGPTIWTKQGTETKYSLRLIPLGGYVNMEGESEHSEQEGSFSKASIPKRIAIVVAGAAVNIIFAIIIYFILMATAGNNISTVVDTTIPGYAAESAQIMQGDKIEKINGKKVRTSSDINEIMSKNSGEEITITIKRDNQEQNITLVPTEVKYKSTGIYLYGEDSNSTKIAGFITDSVAEKEGLKVGDTIISVNGENVKDNVEELINKINDSTVNTLKLEVERSGKTISVDIVPEEESTYYIGVQFKQADNNFKNNIYYATLNTGDFMFSIAENVKQLFSGGVSTDQFMGPVGISSMVSKTSGVREFIYMLALISMSLGITNLIPFPPLDGGKILFLIIEAIRRKPVSEKLEIQVQLIGFAILIGLSIYVTYHDILRIL